MVSKRKYTVLVKKRVAKLMQTLSEPYYSALKSAMYSLADNPRPYGYKKLRGESGYRIRVGDYRSVYEIFDDIVTVEIIKINHRKEVYKKK